MKYVMFTNVKTGLKMPVIFAEQFSHAEVILGESGWVATSAGFFSAVKGFQTHGRSDSLGLAPLSGDVEVIKQLMAGVLNSMAYLVQDVDENRARLRHFCECCGHHASMHCGGRPEEKSCEVHRCKCRSFKPISG